jgi:small-conductance mechanosensitive channel
MQKFVHAVDQYGIRIELVLGSVAILVVCGALIVVIERSVRRLLHRVGPRIHLGPAGVLAAGRLVRLLAWTVVALVVLEYWGIGVGGAWTLLGSAAAVIGVGFLAVWTMISNITASLLISLWRPFHLDETVELLPEKLGGKVVERNLMFTVLREGEGSVVLVPNNLFFQKIFRVSDAKARYGSEVLDP